MIVKIHFNPLRDINIFTCAMKQNINKLRTSSEKGVGVEGGGGGAGRGENALIQIWAFPFSLSRIVLHINSSIYIWT